MALRRRSNRVRAEARARYYIREQASRRGWDTRHLGVGGDFLEENEIEAAFPDIGLEGELPDFLVCRAGAPVIVVEAKNDARRLQQAIEEACAYADRINATGRYAVRLAVGAAGEEDRGFSVTTRFLSREGWVPLTFNGAELTSFPSVREADLAIAADNGTTTVSIPGQNEFIDAAVELSIILRQAKVEAPLRPKVIGAMVAAMYQGEIDTTPEDALESVNRLMAQAVERAPDIAGTKKAALVDALSLTGADFNRLAPSIGRIVSILNRLNVRSVLQTDTDFLGMFYEAFLRYGYDNNALGIVFTPRHITRLCVDLVGVTPQFRAIDIACGTGGFLVAAFDRMLSMAESAAQRDAIKSSIYGFDTNPTIWALATLNMFFRGDGKSHIQNESCFEALDEDGVARSFDRAFLNPPFSQEDEPEYQFINASMEALRPGGVLAAVVYAGVFADDEHKHWRREFLRSHTLLGVVSLPEELFYPTAAPTSIVIARAHVPHGDQQAFMARVWNDGFEKLKGRRVPRAGEQLTELRDAYEAFQGGRQILSEIAAVVPGESLRNGEEWSPQQWLPQPENTDDDVTNAESEVIQSVFQTVAHFPTLADIATVDFVEELEELPDLPLNVEEPLSYFFTVTNGRSSGEKNYTEGDYPYVSSGDMTNSVTALVGAVDEEVFESGGITVTAFGQASLQPWPFLARGNGGSSVRVLVPRFKMSLREVVWFIAQINMQRWRFFYARMAIKSRLSDEKFKLKSPMQRMPDGDVALSEKIAAFRDSLAEQSRLW